MPRFAGQLEDSKLASTFACLALSIAASTGLSQDISVSRLPQASDMTVRLENLASHLSYERSGDSYFIVPEGRYSVQLLRQGRVVYQEVEFIGSDSPETRTVAPSGDVMVVGLPEGNPTFDPNSCAALEDAARLAISRFGLRAAEVRQRLAHADFRGDFSRCGTNGGMDAFAAVLAGSYGVTPLGMVGVSIDFLPLSPSKGPHRAAAGGASHQNAWMTQLTGLGLVDGLKQGFSDVAVAQGDRAFLSCAAMAGDAPLFCNSDGQVVGPAEVASFRGIYRIRLKTTPVDYRGVEDDHWTSFVGEEEYRATQEKLTADLQRIQNNLLQRIDELELKALKVPHANTPNDGGRYYATADLTSLIGSARADIDGALRDEKLQPLRRHFPEALAKLSVSPQPFAPEQDTFRVFRELKNTLTLLARTSGDLGVDLVFRTTPVETEGARLTFSVCPTCKPIVSQGGEHRFYRGRYYVTTNLDGYVPYEGWLDLVDDPKTILECSLVRITSRNGSHESTCSLKSQ